MRTVVYLSHLNEVFIFPGTANQIECKKKIFFLLI